MTASRTILIAGAGTGGYWNVGDAAIFEAMVRQLRRFIPSARISLVSANPADTFAALGVEEIRFDRIPEICAAAERSDLMILGGGGIFYDYWDYPAEELLTPAHGGISFYTGFAMLARLLRKPLMAYAAGVGPLMTERGRKLTRFAFEQADAITVRDEASARLLEELGIPTDRISVTADPVFGVDEPGEFASGEAAKWIAKEGCRRPLIAVAIRSWALAGDDGNGWQQELAASLDALLEATGGTAIFLPMHRAAGDVDDRLTAQAVISRMRRQRDAFQVSGYPGVDEISAFIAQSDLVIGMRLHSLIFAQNHAVPFVGIVYDPKVRSAIDSELGRFAVPLEQLRASTLTPLLREALERRSELSEKLRAGRKSRSGAAESNAAVAAELLSRSERSTGGELSRESRSLMEDLALRQMLRANDLEATISRLEEGLRTSQEGIAWLRSEVQIREQRIREIEKKPAADAERSMNEKE